MNPHSTPGNDWHGKAVVVTGGARGQGGALALMLLQAGAEVHVLDRLPPQDLAWQNLRAQAAAAPERLVSWNDDVSDPQAWERLATALQAGSASLVGLVNNAGITGPRNTATATQLSDWEQIMAINVTGAMLGIRALAPLMKAGAAIVNISSTAGLTGYYNAAYCTSKWALRGLTRSAAMELAPRGIRVNCVCPGVVDTDMIHNHPVLMAALQQAIPVQHMAAPQQIAEVVLFLLGAQSSYVTGADFAVDGGVSGGGIYWPVGRAVGALVGTDESKRVVTTNP